MLKIDNIILEIFNPSKHKHILDEIKMIPSKIIPQVEERLLNSRNVDTLEFSNAYLVNINSNIVGYIYLSEMRKNIIYIDYLILKNFRKKGIGFYTMDIIRNHLLENNTNLKEIRFNIDKSNLGSILLADKLGFIADEDYSTDKIDYIMDNPNFKVKKNNRNWLF